MPYVTQCTMYHNALCNTMHSVTQCTNKTLHFVTQCTM
jgi:hypothetical protein